MHTSRIFLHGAAAFAAAALFLSGNTIAQTIRLDAGPIQFDLIEIDDRFISEGVGVADVNKDGYDDLLVASYGGEVRAALGPSGTIAWSYDLYAQYEDVPFGHIAVDDIDRDGTLARMIWK